MRSKLAEAAGRDLIDGVKYMTAEQRLAAFLAHCHLMADVAELLSKQGVRCAVIGAMD